MDKIAINYILYLSFSSSHGIIFDFISNPVGFRTPCMQFLFNKPAQIEKLSRLIIVSGYSILAEEFYKSASGFFRIFGSTEGGKTEITFTTRAEAFARCAYDLYFAQDVIKEIPA